GISCFGSLENIMNAYDTIFRHLKSNYNDLADLRKYWGYVATNVVFIQISTDVSSALKIFETINERGIGLNPMDLLKNLLFKQVNTQEFTKLKDEWKKITKPLEQAKEKPLRFLRYFLMANYNIEIYRTEKERRDAVVREDEIYDWFIKKENAALCEYSAKPFEFVRKIVRNVELYLGYASGLGNDGQPSIVMDNLKRLCGGAFSLHYVLLLAAGNLPKALFDHFVTQLESFLFFYIFTKTPTKELERNFSQWADELRAIAGITNASEQATKLNTFISEKFKKNIDAKQVEFSDALKRYTLHSMQQYRTRYLLAKLTQYVDMAYKGLRTSGSLGEYTVLEIEHILPNTPEKDLRSDFTIKNPQENYDDYKIKLGNLTLLEKPINIVASNNFFALKKIEYAKCKYYLTSSIAGLTPVGKNSSITRINEKLLAFDDWNATDIDRRQAMLIDLAHDVWRVKEM
ncbi:MAG: HNH endonuclease family protein, partial [Desulfobacterales bacterium]|nr:HNH endonuclease family protein [Desulfobacterales bacterium]